MMNNASESRGSRSTHHIYIYIYMDTYMYMCVRRHTHICVMYVYVQIHMYTWMYLCHFVRMSAAWLRKSLEQLRQRTWCRAMWAVHPVPVRACECREHPGSTSIPQQLFLRHPKHHLIVTMWRFIPVHSGLLVVILQHV